MLGEHAVLAVHGDEVAGPDPAQQLDEVLPAAVARHVDLRGAGVDDVAAEAEEVADEPRDRALVARDGARGEDHGVPGAGRDVAVLADADHGERGERLALAAGHEHDGAVAGRRPRAAAGGIAGRSERRSRPRSSATSALSTMRRPRKRHRPAGLGRARSATRWMRGIEVAKQETSTRPRVRSRTSLERGHDVVLAAGEPRLLDVRAVGEQHEHAAVAPGGESASTSVRSSRRRRGVDLEVAAREHDPGRRLDREGEAVEDAVGDADGVDAEGADLHRLARHEGPQVGVDAALLRAACARSRA